MGVQGGTCSGNTQEYKGFHESEGGYKVVQGNTWEYRRIHRSTGVYIGVKGDIRVQRDI